MEIRIAKNNDYAKLCDLWHKVFGDDAKYIDDLYDSLSAIGYVLDDGEDIKSCVTVFNVGTYQNKVVSFIYALATEPAARGNGYGSKLTLYARDKIINAGNIAMVCPSEESLISYYKKLDFEEFFYIEDDDEYEFDEINEKYLNGVSHIELGEQYLKFIIKQEEPAYGKPCLGKGKSAIVQGLIYSKEKISRHDDEYPYFGFIMK